LVTLERSFGVAGFPVAGEAELTLGVAGLFVSLVGVVVSAALAGRGRRLRRARSCALRLRLFAAGASTDLQLVSAAVTDPDLLLRYASDADETGSTSLP
jgi:hypothetical protein